MAPSKKDSIIVLSHFLTPERELSEESKLRVEEGVRRLKKSISDFIIMNGGPGRFTENTPNTPYGERVQRGTRPVHCEVMREYAIMLGIPREKILVQDYSSDTIGEAYFVQQEILILRGWKDNEVITGDYHAKPRVQAVYNFVLGPGFTTTVIPVVTGIKDEPSIIKNEASLLQWFEELFKDVREGDSRTIEHILYTKHPHYSEIPEQQRRRYFPKTR